MNQFDKKKEMQEQSWKLFDETENLVYYGNQLDWQECIESRLKDIYQGEDLKFALEIMKILDSNGSIEDVEKAMKEKELSTAKHATVITIIAKFSKKGPEFCRHYMKDILTPKDEIFLRDIEEKNVKLAQEQAEIDSQKEKVDD